MKPVILTIVRTGSECASYRLTDVAGRVVWSNRVYDRPEGHQGARERLAAGRSSMGTASSSRERR